MEKETVKAEIMKKIIGELKNKEADAYNLSGNYKNDGDYFKCEYELGKSVGFEQAIEIIKKEITKT